MTPSFNLLLTTALAYVTFLFAVAFWAERRARTGRSGWVNSPLIYTLSLSIYCTAWTFYGAVGYAARSGLEFVTIYLGPTLVMVGWWWVVRKLVRIGRAQRVTSVADLISSRFGKSGTIGVIVTVIAVIAATPYIALQLQSMTLSFGVFAEQPLTASPDGGPSGSAVWVAVGLAVFTILFGTRSLDVNERHHGVVMAIAVEAVVKLFALVAVGLFVVWGLGGGPVETMERIAASPIPLAAPDGGRWVTLIFLAGAAFLCLPRMFQVLVVENSDEGHLRTAAWAFPLYLFAMSLFVVPIAVTGLDLLPEGSNPDLFVLTLPLSQGQGSLAVLSFLGGFSSATSMVIVSTLALATMVSNQMVVPLWLRSRGDEGAAMSGDVRKVILQSRRASIAGVLALGYLYYRLSGGGAALAAIGLVSFTGAVQVLPAMLGGIFWRGATRTGAIWGLSTGLAIWLWTLFLPSLGVEALMPMSVLEAGPFGITGLRPQALFGLAGIDPLVHGVVWSLFLNTSAFILVSLVTFPSPMERLQGAQFVNVFEHSTAARGWTTAEAGAEDLLIMAQRIMGGGSAQRIFQDEAARQGKTGYLPEVTPAFLDRLERELSGSVGAATAHAMIGQIVGGSAVSVDDLIAVADEAAQIMEYSARLEAKSAEQERTARALRTANEQLTALSVQKDAFLNQISHELRTPMTSIRAFSEILREGGADEAAQARFAGIIHDESLRLTRLLDDLLDLAVLENGQVTLHRQSARIGDLLERAIAAAGDGTGGLQILRDRGAEAVEIVTDTDRLVQVFINLISNARKYCEAEQPRLRITVRERDGAVQIDFADNGKGIPEADRKLIFEKFSRLTDSAKAGGAGLGLAICREIMRRLGGEIAYLPGQFGAAFRLTLPREVQASPASASSRGRNPPRS